MPLTLRAWLRYVVPFTLLAIIACAPLLYVASRVGAAESVMKARGQVRLAWILAGTAWMWQFLLVAGVAPGVRSVARGAPLSQWRAFASGIASLAHGFVPWLIVVAAVLIGQVALVVPGLLLGIMLAMTGASTRLSEPPPAPLVDSIAVARTNLVRIALAVIAIIVVTLVVAFVAQKLLVPTIAKKAPVAKLAPIRDFVRVVALSITILAPLAACTLAATYERFTRQTR